MKTEDNGNFLDARTLLAILLVGMVFVGWQMYMQHKYPDNFNKKPEIAATTNEAVSGKTPGAETATKSTAQNPAASAQATVRDGSIAAPSAVEKLTPYASENLAFDISSKGMGLKGVHVVKFKNRQGEIVELGHPEYRVLPLETGLLGRTEPLDFEIEKINPNMFVGHAQVGALRITKTMEIIPEKYVIQYKIVASGTNEKFVGLTTAITEEIEIPEHKNLLLPQRQKQEFFIDTAETHERVLFGKDDVDKSWSKVKLASAGSQYFTQAIVDNSSVMPEARARVDHKGRGAEIVLQYPVLNKSEDFQLNYKAFVGPKSLSLLQAADSGLTPVVDFGFFNWIGRHILDLLRAFYALVGNWGWAVICLTIVVRLLVLPLNIYSYKSMRAMQAIQPQIQAMRERLKDDQAKQQQEMMALMKNNKVNPLAGCLPVFLQFPIFIALYQVLGNSIELYQAPFGLWIHDLSLKDPFYILPVLMGLTMFVQQKITPNTMDPAQAKVMLMMPLIFTFFMVSLPSGLTLYMLVGAVFSVVQQTYFLKQSKTLSGGRAV